MTKSSNFALIPNISPTYDGTHILAGEFLIADPLKYYNEHTLVEWTEEENATFTQAYLDNPKKFGVIAEKLPNKTASQCVHHYYATKNKFQYKKLLRKTRSMPQPLSKLNQPKRKAAMKALKTFTDMDLEPDSPKNKRKRISQLTENSEIGKFAEVWVEMDESHFAKNYSNGLAQGPEAQKFHNSEPIESKPFPYRDKSFYSTNSRAEDTSSTISFPGYIIEKKNNNPAVCIINLT